MLSIQTIFIALALTAPTPVKDSIQFKKEVAAEFAKHKGTYGFALKDLTTGEEILINGNENFHAASTMKTPVLLEAYKQAAQGNFSLSDSIVIGNTFKSIVDGSAYSLDPEADSEKELYTRIGRKATIYSLLHKMITESSNLATNIMIDIVGAQKVNASMEAIGARNIRVLRGVEDTKAFRAGKNNTVTAYDLMLIFEQLGAGKAVNPEASKAMLNILMDQHFTEVIAGKLPSDVKVASKSGSIQGIIHDSGIVYLPDGRKYVIILLSKNAEDNATATETLAKVSLMAYHYIVNK